MTAAERLAELIRIPTISSLNPAEEDPVAFSRIPEKLAELYPAAHRVMERELPGDRAIIYRWKGSIDSLEPVLGLAHFDVVPPGDESTWEHPPFAGTIIGDRIHGRGSLDDKGMLAAWMEAVESLADQGYQPCRTLYLAFGGDEETTGNRGAGLMASLFAERGIRFAFIFDEGGAVATDQLAVFTSRPVALVGIAEKGYLTLKITAAGMSGHASSPPRHTAAGRLGAALAALEKHRPRPRLTQAPTGMLKALGRAAGGFRAFMLRHPEVFGGILKKALAGGVATSPLVRTTLAPTVIRGGERENVLPDSVEALVNLRLLPGDSVSRITDRMESIISRAVDGGVTVEAVDGSVFDPVPASGQDGHWWDRLGVHVERHFTDVVLAPYLMKGTTDSRWYRHLSDSIFRFVPMEVNSREMESVHAPNESISLKAWGKSLVFIEDFMKDVLKDETE